MPGLGNYYEFKKSKTQIWHSVDGPWEPQIDIKEVDAPEEGESSSLEKISNHYYSCATHYCKYGALSDSDSRFADEIEELVGINESNKDDFRRDVSAFVGYLLLTGLNVAWDSHLLLSKAFKKYEEWSKNGTIS